MFCLISKTVGMLNDELEIVNGQQVVGLGKVSTEDHIEQSVVSYLKHIMKQDIAFMNKTLQYKIQHNKHKNGTYVMTLIRIDEEGDSINVEQIQMFFTKSFDVAQTTASRMLPQDKEGKTLCLYALNYPLQLESPL